jgi:hypothetical protein
MDARQMMRWACLLLLVAAPAFGQRMRGSVRDGNGSAVSGAVITLLDSVGRPISRTLSDGNGVYSLTVGASAARLRAVKIGFRPLTVEVKSGDANVDLTMERAPVILETMRITSDPDCRGAGDASLVREVLEQARAALLAAIVARDANPARVHLIEFQRHLDVRNRTITEQRILASSGVSKRPISAARSGAQLAATGYRSEDRGDNVYFAPDADVLFDDSFGETHCFGLTRGSRDRAGQIGLTFRPRSVKRDFVDVDGTLWLGSQGTELLQLDYRYTNVDAEAARVGAGGTMHFRTMPNGVVLIDSWSILVPVMTELRRIAGAGAATQNVVSDLVETGGYVLQASWADSTRWSEPLGGVRGVVRTADAGTPVYGVIVSAPGASAETNLTGEYLLQIPPGRYRLGLVDSTFAGYAKPRQQSREIVVTRSDAVTEDFRLPSRESVLSDLCRGNRAPGTSILLGRVEDRTGSLPEKLAVRSSWLTSRAGSSDVIDLNQLRQAHQVTEPGEDGRFYICGVPAQSSWITLKLELGRIPIVDTTIAPSSIDAPVAMGTRRLDWTLPAGVLQAAMRGDGATLTGRVTRNGNPVADAEVWVVFRDTTVRTDSLGRFRVGGLSAGEHLIQVRRIGYAATRDSVTLKARDVTVKDFVMDGARELDTVRTIGKGRAYDAPRLQEFEKRRLSGMGGNFVSEDALRELDGLALQNVLRNFIPGARFETKGGQAYLMSRAFTSSGDSPKGCYATVFLDGILLYDGAMSIPAAKEGQAATKIDNPPNINQFMTLSLSGVEYYRGGASLPLQYRSRSNDCGTLLLWTRGK